MEQKDKRGGIRNGAGRKPLGTLNKKQALTVFVEGAVILKFGTAEKAKNAVVDFMVNYSDVKTVPKKQYDASKLPPNIQDESKQWVELTKPILPSEQFILEANEAKNKKELENILSRAKKELEYFPYQKVVEATKHLFDNFFND